MRLLLVTASFALYGATVGLAAPAERPPILDVHMHSLAPDAQGPPPLGMCTPIDPFPAWDPAEGYGDVFLRVFKKPPCADPTWSAKTDAEMLTQTLEIMRRRNVFGVLSGSRSRVDAWIDADPQRFMGATSIDFDEPAAPAVEALRARHAQGRLSAIAEVAAQYQGILPDDSRLEPYWQLAQEIDVPVGIHVGPGPPGAIYLGSKQYRARLHSALTLEETLVRHRKLRLWVMHAGFPLLDDMLAMLYAHPQVYVDVGVIVYTQPRPAFYRYLRALVEGGFANRVMFGSDQMVWPGAIERSIAVIEEAPFLSAQQKRAILYENAARFFRLDDETRGRHRAMGAARSR
jgi:predicted TIM-barrel fold metal-dependent hydrolase